MHGSASSPTATHHLPAGRASPFSTSKKAEIVRRAITALHRGAGQVGSGGGGSLRHGQCAVMSFGRWFEFSSPKGWTRRWSRLLSVPAESELQWLRPHSGAHTGAPSSWQHPCRTAQPPNFRCPAVTSPSRPEETRCFNTKHAVNKMDAIFIAIVLFSRPNSLYARRMSQRHSF